MALCTCTKSALFRLFVNYLYNALFMLFIMHSSLDKLEI